MDMHSKAAPSRRPSLTTASPAASSLGLVVLWAISVLLLALPTPALAQRALLSHAEQPAKLIRKTTVYDAPAGSGLLPGDIIESGARGLQIEWANGALVALGPSSSVHLAAASGTPVVNLLRGWVKMSAGKTVTGRVHTAAGALEVRASATPASGIVHLEQDTTEVFTDLGTLSVSDKDKGGDALPVLREQYALSRGAGAPQIAARPPKRFITEMPRSFFDPLVAVAARTAPAQAAPLREVAAGDLIGWGAASPVLRKRLVAQFSPRLADPSFAKDAEIVLGDNPDWRPALQQQAGAKKRNAVSNYLF